MNPIYVDINKMDKMILQLGFVGENERTRIIFQCGSMFAEYPNAVPALSVQAPKGSPYPVIITRDGNNVIWDVKDSSLTVHGSGEVQLTFTENGKVAKSFRCKTNIEKSTVPKGNEPDPIQDFVVEAETLLDDIPQQIADALQAAKESHEFDGQDGVSPTVTTSPISGGHSVNITDRTGDHEFTVMNGQNGISPNITVTDIQGGHRVKIVDVSGTNTFDIPNGDPATIIDDTAGTGVTNKTLSADKITTEFGSVLTAIQGVKEETNGNFANLVTVVKGYDYLHMTVTTGKYANYSSKVIWTLSETNVLEFDVSHVAKFKYKYTIENPDLRGLFFKDKNGNALTTSYQTKATEQDITVPSGAVKCCATVISTDQIVVYEILAGDQPTEILRSQATYTSRTSGGITYTWNNDNTKVNIDGTRTNANFDTMYDNSTKLPTGMVRGKKVRIEFSTPNDYIKFVFIPYINGAEGTAKPFSNGSTIFEVPDTWEGVNIRLSVYPGSGTVKIEDVTIDCPEIYTVPDTIGLEDRVNDLENAVYTNSADNPLALIRRDAGLLSIFHTVGCIGDSLSSGECVYKTSGTTHFVDLYPFSWGQCLARLTGNTYYNFSQGGLTTKTWLSSQHCTDCFDGNHDCDMYFIGLGQNDKNVGMTVGTTADINLSDYTQNADTYCGNMGKIIQKLQEHEPKAPIFIFIDPNPPMGDQAYNNVIPDIVELFDNVWIIDLKTYAQVLFTDKNEIIGSQARSGHYSALGYQQIAFVIATYVDWIVRNNLSAFSQVEFIGTNYEW